jgi:hypothetical protein
MNRIAKLLALATFTAVFGSAAVASAGINETVVPAAVGCQDNGECFIILATQLAQTSCADHSQVRFRSTQAGAEFMYKAALSALLSGKKLVINPNGSCQGQYPKPAYLFISN